MDKNYRCRNWAFIIYPENIKIEDAIVILDDLHIQFVLSPLHNKDINPDGSKKKEHYHCVLCFAGNKSYQQVEVIAKSVKGSIPIKIESVKGMVRYFAHLDNPEKYQYDPSKIQFFGGLSSNDILSLSSTERYKIIKDMIIYIIDERVVSFNDFLSFCIAYHYDDYFPVLCDSSVLIVKEAIKSNWLKYCKTYDNRVGE